MIDLKLDATGDLELSAAGDISATDSIVQAVRIRLLWFFGEWRLMPSLGFPYFENLLSTDALRLFLSMLNRISDTSVTPSTDITVSRIRCRSLDSFGFLTSTFNTDEDSFREEVKIPWQNMA